MQQNGGEQQSAQSAQSARFLVLVVCAPATTDGRREAETQRGLGVLCVVSCS